MRTTQDPLVVMPLLIPYQGIHAVQVIRVVSEKANAKEILLVLQEILERLIHDDDQDQEDEMQEETSGKLSPTLQLERVVFSYTYSKTVLYPTTTMSHTIELPVLPRALPKVKTTGERLQGVLHDLEEHIRALVPQSQPREGQAVLHSVTAFTNNLMDYFADHLSDLTQLTPCIVSKIGLEN